MSGRAPAGAALLLSVLVLGCQGRARDAAAKDAGQKEPTAHAPSAAPAEPAPTGPVAGPPGAAPTAPAAAAAPAEQGEGTAPAGTPADSPAPLWRVKDNGVRCVRAPCPTLDAVPVNSSAERAQVAEVDLSALGLSAKDTQRLLAELYGKGLLVRGEVEIRRDPRGRPYPVLRATGLPSR